MFEPDLFPVAPPAELRATPFRQSMTDEEAGKWCRRFYLCLDTGKDRELSGIIADRVIEVWRQRREW